MRKRPRANAKTTLYCDVYTSFFYMSQRFFNILSGAGSYPPFENGLHLMIRQQPSKIPINTPWLLMHSIVYCEQVGRYKHV